MLLQICSFFQQVISGIGRIDWVVSCCVVSWKCTVLMFDVCVFAYKYILGYLFFSKCSLRLWRNLDFNSKRKKDWVCFWWMIIRSNFTRSKVSFFTRSKERSLDGKCNFIFHEIKSFIDFCCYFSIDHSCQYLSQKDF